MTKIVSSLAVLLGMCWLVYPMLGRKKGVAMDQSSTLVQIPAVVEDVFLERVPA